MKVYVVIHEYDFGDDFLRHDIVGIYDSISKAAWTIWEILYDKKISDRLLPEFEIPSVEDIANDKHVEYRKNLSSFWGCYYINEYEVK